jgi:hypothetical protein
LSIYTSIWQLLVAAGAPILQQLLQLVAAGSEVAYCDEFSVINDTFCMRLKKNHLNTKTAKFVK